MRPLIQTFTIILLIFTTTICQAEDDVNKQTPEQIIKGIQGKHPATYYVLANKLFRTGKKDDALFWFYLGQLRYRFYLSVEWDNLPKSGGFALFSSLSEVVGRPINQYSGENFPKTIKTIDKVLKWDSENENNFTPKKGNEKKLKGIKDGLVKLRDYYSENQAELMEKRKKNGI